MNLLLLFLNLLLIYNMEIVNPEIVNPANTGHSPNAVSMLAHRLQRRPNNETTLGDCPLFAGKVALNESLGMKRIFSIIME